MKLMKGETYMKPFENPEIVIEKFIIHDSIMTTSNDTWEDEL